MKTQFMKAFLMFNATVLLTGCYTDDFRPCIKGNNATRVESRTLAGFTAIDYMMEGDVEIRKAAYHEIVIEGNSNQIEALKTKVTNGKLKIYSERCLKNTDFAFVIYTPELENVKLSGSGDLVVRDDFYSPEMAFDVSGSGSIRASAESSSKVRAKLSGSGKLHLEGACDIFEGQISGSGKINAFALVSNTANCSVSGSGNMEIFVTNTLNADISGSGTIKHKGSATVNSTISGSGRVIQVQ